MSDIDHISYQRTGGTGFFFATANSVRDRIESLAWEQRLRTWLPAGTPPGRAYLHFGDKAAVVRWHAASWSQAGRQQAVALVGLSSVVTARYGLEIPDLDGTPLDSSAGAAAVPEATRRRRANDIGTLACSREVIHWLIPLLAAVLSGKEQVTMPWRGTAESEAVLWGLVSIRDMIGAPEAVSFLTRARSSLWGRNIEGLLVAFSESTMEIPPPDPGFAMLAASLADRFAADPAGLRQELAAHRVPASGSSGERIRRMQEWLDSTQRHKRAPRAGAAASAAVGPDKPPPGPPDAGPPAAGSPSAAPPAAAPPAAGSPSAAPPAVHPVPAPAPAMRAAGPPEDRRGRRDVPGQFVMCPICLHEIDNWDSLGYWRWDPRTLQYREIVVPPGLNRTQQTPHLLGAHVRCPGTQGQEAAHYLPVNYGRYGHPVLLGFVGLTKSGKTHLLASMVHAMENGGLEEYGLTIRPIDMARHQRFLEEWVRPLMDEGKVLPDTQEGLVEFADAFLMSHNNGPERPVALFDVAGGDLVQPDDVKRFLLIANGLFFVVDPANMGSRRVGDDAFINVLNLLKLPGRPGPVSAAIVVNKADKERFDEPVDRWLRTDAPDSRPAALDSTEFLRESADVYAYLHRKHAAAFTSPYGTCDKATLHVASPTGGEAEAGVYPRGVTPRRVLRPLLAMLAMTGVLSGPEAGKVGI